MSTPSQSKKDIQLSKGNSPFEIFISSENPPRGPEKVEWRSEFCDLTDENGTWEFKPIVKFVAAKNAIEFRECWAQVRNGKANMNLNMASRLSLLASNFRIRHFGPDNEDQSIFSILLERKSESTALGHIEKDLGHKDFHHIQIEALALVNTSGLVDWGRFVHLRFHNYEGNKFFFPDEIRKIIDGDYKKTVRDVIDDFVQRQKLALTEEDEARNSLNRDLLRDNCTVRLFASAQDPPKLLARIRYAGRSTTPWLLETDQRVLLRATKVFHENAPFPDAEDNKGWVATITSIQDKVYTAQIDNLIPDASLYDNDQVENVKVSIVEDDLMAKRLHDGISQMRTALYAEHNLLSDEEKAAAPWTESSNMPLSRLFISHPDNQTPEQLAKPIAFQDGATSITPDSSWKLEPSHVRFINAVMSNTGGITGLRGPPGTGKTTLIAKLAAIAVKHFDMEGSILLTAHSNQAAVILLQRCHQVFESFTLQGDSHIVLVETPGRQQRRNNYGPHLSPELESYTLERHLLRAANANRERYGHYIKYHAQFQAREKLTEEEMKAYTGARRALYQKVRDSRKIFICTVSTMHTPFFSTKWLKDGSMPLIALWVNDESSQCPVPAFVEGWLYLNPHRVVIAGDYMQLQCFALSQAAITTWKMSPIFFAEQLGNDACVLLDVQFRMHAYSYAPTNNIHYMGLVKTSPSVGGGLYERHLSTKLRSIEIDPKGTGHWTLLNHDYLVLNLTDGEEIPYGNKSSSNPREAAVVERLLVTLHDVGIDWSDIMALTPYQGQYAYFADMVARLEATGLSARKLGASQGDEKPIVVFSPVKTTKLGYMTSNQRQNVGTSRHRFAFMFVGCLDLRSKSSVWRSWHYEVYKANGSRVTWSYEINHRCQFRVVSTYSRTNKPSVASQSTASTSRVVPTTVTTLADRTAFPALPPPPPSP